MTVDVSGLSSPSATRTGEADPPVLPIDADVWARIWHRTQVHPRPAYGCVLCPCKNGHDQCPDPDGCYRDWAGSETSWRDPARTPASFTAAGGDDCWGDERPAVVTTTAFTEQGLL